LIDAGDSRGGERMVVLFGNGFTFPDILAKAEVKPGVVAREGVNETEINKNKG